MENIKKYKMTITGEFEDKEIERDFFNYDMKRYIKLIRHVALIFGIIFSLFFISDYFAIDDTTSLIIIFLFRLAYFIISVILFLIVNKIENSLYLSRIITAYEFFLIVAFLVIIYQYNSITFLSFYSIIVMTLSIYLIPNKLINHQIISIFLNVTFFMLYSKNIEGLQKLEFLKAIFYDFIILIFCNVNAYYTNYYKRKQYVDSLELIRLSTTDALTDIYNKAKFNEELKNWINYYDRYKNSITIVVFDIDNFKKINDKYGHPIGDNIIKDVTLLVKNTIRSIDIFARWGGDEFVILLTNTGIKQAVEIVEHIRHNIQKNKFDIVESITCSFGLTELIKGDDADSIVKRADKFLYKAKEEGKNTIYY